MIKRCCTLLCVGFLSYLSAGDLSYIDKAHQSLSEWIYNTSNKIDLFFSRYKQSDIKSTDSYIDTSFDTYYEEHQKTLYRYNIKVRLRLPRTSKRLHLVFKDYKNSISSDRQNSSNISDSVGNNSYLLGVAFDKFKSRYLHLRAGSGVRFHGISPDAYIFMHISKKFYSDFKWQMKLNLKAKYFIKRKNEDGLEIIASKVISDSLKFIFSNKYHYRQNYSTKNELVNTLLLEQYLNHKEGLSYSFSLYSSDTDSENLKLRYYLLQTSYKNYFYKNYLYYNFTPGIIFREHRDFKPSFKVVFRIGACFGEK